MNKWRERTVGFVAGAVLFSGVAMAAGGQQTIEVHFAPLKYFFDGVEKQAPEDMQGFLYNGRTYVPLRFVGEALGKQVGYDAATTSVYVGRQPEEAGMVKFLAKEFTAEQPEQKVRYPEISGLEVPEIQGRLNLLLKDTAMLHDTENVVGYGADYEVKLHKGSIANVVIDSYVYTGGAHGMPAKVSLVLNLENGARYELKDLFKPGSDYVGRISSSIKELDTEKNLDMFHPFPGIRPDQGFYLAEDGIVVYFEPYEHTAYALGFLEFTIPYERVQDLIHTEGMLWKGLQK